jgi:hypothetical protein
MPELEVGRLTIRAPGLSEADGRRLADRVVRQLADRPAPAVVSGRSDGGDAEAHVEAITDLDALAERIAAEVARHLG